MIDKDEKKFIDALKGYIDFLKSQKGMTDEEAWDQINKEVTMKKAGWL